MINKSDWEVIQEPPKNQNQDINSNEWEVVKNESPQITNRSLLGGLGRGILNEVSSVPRDVLIGLVHAGRNLHNYPYEMAKHFEKAYEPLGNVFNQIPGSELVGKTKPLSQYLPYDPNSYAQTLGQTGQPSFLDKAIQKGVEYSPEILSTANLLKRGIMNLTANSLRGNLTPEELLNNLRITQGTETGLGDVVGSPFLKRLNENILSKIPFSGVNETMQRTAGQIVNRGHNIMQDLSKGTDFENLDQYLNDALKATHEIHRTNKTALYDVANKLANESNLNLDLPNFTKNVAQYKNAIEDTNILKYEPDLQKLLNRLGRYGQAVKTETKTGALVDKYGNPLIQETKIKTPTLQEANLLKGKLNELAQMHRTSPNPSDRHLSRVFSDLARTLKGDIKTAIEASGNKKLINAYDVAEKNYAKNYSPYLDREIYKFLGGNADPETLVKSFIKTGKSTDRANLINKLTEKLPQSDKNLLGYAYLKPAFDRNNVINPLKLKTLLSENALGPKQFKALFPDEKIRNALNDYVSLIDKNTKALKLMQNPETGQMNMDILPLISGSATSLGAKMLGAPILGKKLSSEATRTKLVNKMIKKSKNK